MHFCLDLHRTVINVYVTVRSISFALCHFYSRDDNRSGIWIFTGDSNDLKCLFKVAHLNEIDCTDILGSIDVRVLNRIARTKTTFLKIVYI